MDHYESNLLPKPVKEIEIIKETKIEKNKIFLVMTDLESYPKILLNNIKSVDILEQENSTAIAEFYVIEKGIGSKILAKQTIYPYSKQVIEVIDGDAKGTKITQIFSEKNSITTIDTKIDLNFKGILSVFAYLPKNNLEHAANTVVSIFVNYAELSDNKSTKIIDDLYREILLRPADQEALQHWGSLLENEKIDKLELRKNILKSQEAIDLKRFDHTTRDIKDLFEDILGQEPTYDELTYYKYLIDIEEITINKIKLELEKLQHDEPQ